MESITREAKGAVISMETTAVANMIFPESSPSDRGIPPMAAWTVALGQ